MSSFIKISEVLQDMGEDDIIFQNVFNSLTKAEDKKKLKLTELSFVTDQVTTDEIFNPDPAKRTPKTAVVLWVDAARFKEAMENVERVKRFKETKKAKKE